MNEPIFILLSAVFGYALGSIPFGLIFARIGGKGDIRNIGSGNIGATNVLRSGSRLLALATLLADGLKGFVAVAVIWQFGNDQAAFVAGLAAFTGHLFPVWLDFKGGKGVAVFIGAMLMMSPLTGLAFVLIWLLMTLALRISSLSAITALVLTLPMLAWLGEIDTLLYAAIMVGLSLYAHRDNISRLRAGMEPKIGA